MTERPSSFADLMQKVFDGSEDAVRALLEQYGEPVYKAVRRRMHRRLRSKFDSQDFVQSVWKSFFARREELGGLHSPDELARVLVRMAENKVIESGRSFFTRKRNLHHEVPLVHETVAHKSKLRSAVPTPSEVAVVNEEFKRLMADEPERERRVAELRALRSTCQEVADALGVSDRTVRRVLERLREKRNEP